MTVIKNKLSKTIKGADKKGDFDISYLLLASEEGNYLKSTDYAKTLDVLCEGPIEGFIDREGERVYGSDILKAIYLDGNPIKTSADEYNFQNISVDYRLGLENQDSIPRYSKPIINTEVNAPLLGAFIPGDVNNSPEAQRKAIYSYEFEYYSDQEVEIRKKTDPGNHQILEYRTELKTLTNVTVLDPGKGYDNVTTAEPKFEPEYNQFQTFDGRIEEEPTFDITYNVEGGVDTISILNGGRFNVFDSYTGYSGTAPIEQWYVSGTITGNLQEAAGAGEPLDRTYRGSGSITYDEYRPDEFGSLVATNVTETGFFDTQGYYYISLFGEAFILYYGYLPQSGGFAYDHYFVQGADKPFNETFGLIFEGPTAYTGYSGILDPLYISGRTTELGFNDTVNFPTSDINLAVLGQTDTDIRSNQEDYAGWNTNKSEPYDYFPYTHIITNDDVDSVDLVVSIARLNDTQYEADSIFEVWKEPEFSFFGGADDGEASVAFSIGRPEDSFVKFKVEIGFTNTDYGKETFEYVVNGQTVEGYLKELKDINLPTYKSLSSQLFSSSLPELKSRYKRYVKITKNMFETDSVLINRDVALSSIKEKINSNFRYPFSTLVGTTIDSRTFETVPVRTYNTQLKRIQAPENYKPLTQEGLDKRFQTDEENYNGVEILDVSTFTHEDAFPTLNIGGERSSYGRCLSAHKESYVLSWEDFGKLDFGIPDQSYGNLFYFPGDGTREAIKAGTTRYYTLAQIQKENIKTFDFVYPEQVAPYIQNQLTLEPFVGYQWEFNGKVLVIAITVGGNVFTTPPIEVEFYSTKISMSVSSPYLKVPPGKLSLLEFNCSWEVHPDTKPDAFIETAEIVGGIVVGFVENMSDPKPKYIIRKINRAQSFDKQTVEIYHEDPKTLYVKFFAVQLYPLSNRSKSGYGGTYRDIDQVIDTAYNIEDELKKVDEDNLDYGYADIGDDAGLQLRPYSMRITNLKMEEVILGNFYSLGDEFVELSDQYIICDARRNGAFGVIDKYIILVLKRNKATKTWHFFQEIESWNSQPINGIISEDEKRIIFHSRSSDSIDKPIKVYDFDDSTKQFERTALIGRFEGDFKGQRVISSSNNNQSWMASPDRNTIIIHEPQSRLVNEINSTNYNVVFVYKEINGIFSLHQLIQPPDSENLGTTWPAVDARMDWLIVGYRDHRNDEDLKSDGSAALFRYNGKIYEYVKTFWGDQVTDPILGSVRRLDENFGATVAMGQNKNGDLEIAITSEFNEFGEQSKLYIYEIYPDKDEFAEWSINTSTELLLNRTSELQRGVDLDGTNVLVYMEKLSSDVTSQVLKVKKKSPKNSKRIYEDALGWNGIMQEKWTDNPVWIVYDMLTNPVYGAGVALDDLEDINIFNFYNLGKYFDSVDEKGFFIPLYDEKGSTEPRFSCNFLLKESFNAFDVINSITDLFFGALYLSNGQYNLWADVPTETTFFFNNEDVVDGNFTYSDKPKNERTTIIEVPYLDKYDDFKPKIEYIEDSVLMRENGKISKRLEFGAFTTRSQARRFGKQYIYNNSYETEKITFETDNKALFLNPGDVIGVNDDLKRFSTEKMFWSVDQTVYEEKIHIVQHPSGTSSTSGFLYSEATLNDGELSNAKWDFKQIKTINGNGSTQYPRHFDLKTDNNGTPYILAQSTDNISLYRKTGDSFDRLSFTNLDDPYATSLQCESYIDFDSNNVPYISLIGNGVYNNGADQGVGFMKLVGNNFSDPASWQVRYIAEIDPLQEGLEADRRISKIKIDDLNNIYLLTRVVDRTPISGELNLYKINESSNYFARYRFGGVPYSNDDMRFDIQIKNGTIPAIAYKASEGPTLYRLDPHIFYTEYVGGDFENSSSWNDVFVHGTEDLSQDDIKLSFNKNIPFISNSSHLENDIRIYTPLTGDIWNHANWATNKTFITQPAIYSAAPLIFLGNNDPVLFKTDYNISNGDRKKGLSTFQFKEDLSKFQMTQKWEFNQVYGHENVSIYSSFVNSPSVDNFITQPPKITLLNSRRDFFDNDFELDLNTENNLEVNYLGGTDVDLKNLYNKTQFEDFIVNEDFEVTKSFLTITGYEESGSYLNLYPTINKESIETIQLLKAKGTLVRPVKANKKPTEYRVLNIIEKDQNLFEVQGREFHSGKFSAIESAENISSPLQEIYNIGIPSHTINKPSQPIGISYDVGTDEGGGAFVIGSITGEVNGSETKYRLSITSPNLKYKYIEIEKDFENLSPQNEPITNYGFYNLNQPGEYELTVKSLRNPESSTFISQKFEIEFGEKVSDKPYISSINIFNKDEYIKLEIDTRNVYGDKFELTNGKASIDIKLNGVLWQADRTIKTFETSLQELKEFCGLNHRAIVIDVELFYDGAKVSEITKTLTDKPPRINNAEFLSDGADSLIKFDMEDDFKLRLVSVYYSGEKIKTHQLKNQNQTQIINFYDFEIEKIPVSSDLSFSLIPEDVYGTGQSFDISGFIPEKQSSLDIYNESIITIYSINSQDQSSGVFDNFNSSNGLTKFYGTNRDSLIEFSSSLVSGYSGSISAKIISDTDSKDIPIEFDNLGFKSTKKITNLLNEEYSVYISGQYGLFDGYELKIKKL